MSTYRTLVLTCAMTATLAGCTDLSFLDDAITETGKSAVAPELVPQSQLAIPQEDEIAENDPTEQVLARGSALQARANGLR